VKIRDKQLAFFLRHLAGLLETGIPVGTALIHLEERRAGGKIRRLVQRLRSFLAQGRTFGDAVERCPRVFLPVYRAMIVAGETAGRLPEILREIADLLESAIKRRRRLVLAMLYPCFVILLAAGAMVVLAGFVFPRFKEFFDSEHAELPAVTRSLLVTAGVLKWLLPWIGAVLVFAVFARLVLRGSTLGRTVSDYLALAWSPFRSLHRKEVTARCARALGMLQECGLPIVRSIRLAGAAGGNAIAEQIFVNAGRLVDRGQPLSEALGRPRLLDSGLVPVLRAGEQTGALDQMLRRLADELDAEVQHARRIRMVAGMTLTIVLLGVLVGWIVIAVMSAYFGMAAAMF